MTSTDWIIDIALILIVIRQLREAPMNRRFWLLPLVIVGYTASHYLTAVPTAGNDVVVIALLTLVGMTLGLLGGITTRVRAENGQAFVRAGWIAASLWVGSMTARLGFIYWITHSGSDDLVRFSMHHDITSSSTWQDALVLMALAEVIVRIGILVVRGHRAAEASRVPTTPQPELLSV